MANEPTPTLESLLGEVMRDPAKLAQVRALASSLGLDAPPSEPTPTPEPAPVPEPPAPLPALGALGGLMPLLQSASKLGLPEQHRTLLLALRPYLGERRQEMIDTIVRLGRLGDVLGGGGD